ncbi:MAG: SH3 domain-containing protein [Pseudomonadota bacterium]
MIGGARVELFGLLSVFSIMVQAAEINLSACQGTDMAAKMERSIQRLYQDVATVQACDHDWLKFVQRPETADTISERIGRLTLKQPPSSQCWRQINTINEAFNQAFSRARSLSPTANSCSHPYRYTRLSRKLPNATHFVMVGAANVRELLWRYDPIAQTSDSVSDTLAAGTPVQWIAEQKNWGFFRYIKADKGYTGWIRMDLVYPIRQVR